MSKIKNHYHDQICEGMRLAKESEQHDIDYHGYLADRAKEYGIEPGPLPLSPEMINTITEAMNAEDRMIEEMAEEHGFFSIFEKTRTYPC